MRFVPTKVGITQNLSGTNNLAKIVKHEFQLIPHLGGFFVVKYPVDEKTVEISVGTIFKVPGYKNRTDIVVNTGEENWFFASRCSLKKNRLLIIGGVGTSGPEYFLEKVGQVSVEDVKQKMVKYYEKYIKKPLDDEFKAVIEREVSGQSRRINLE